MKRVSYLPPDILSTTAAWQVYNTGMLCNTRKVMRLLYMMHNTLNNSPTARQNNLRDPENANWAAEFSENIEFHAAYDCIRKTIQENKPLIDSATGKLDDSVVAPYKKIARLDNLYHQSPIEKAGHIGVDYPILGERLKKRMNSHDRYIQSAGNRLTHQQFIRNSELARTDRPHFLAGDSYTESSPYAHRYTPAQLEAWR